MCVWVGFILIHANLYAGTSYIHNFVCIYTHTRTRARTHTTHGGDVLELFAIKTELIFYDILLQSIHLSCFVFFLFYFFR
jgi:hypothetical protein